MSATEVTEPERKALVLKNPPIIEAVLDIECDMPPRFDLAAMEEPARKAFGDRYPRFQTQFIQQHQIEERPDTAPRLVTNRGLQSLQWIAADGKQLVQVRTQGFSFNRLAPYSTLDDYTGEIERTWRLFVDLTAPIQVRSLRLRYINRILLPLAEGHIELDDFLRLGPRLPAQDKLRLSGFLNQYLAAEAGTPNRVKSVLTTQPIDSGKLPLVFDIETERGMNISSSEWAMLASGIQSLRRLKNQVFQDTLTARCLNLFQT